MWLVFAGNAPPVLPIDKIPHETAEVEPALPVLLADEVDIMTMQATDTTALVVGLPPVHEPLVLAAASEITLDRVEPDVDGMMPGRSWTALNVVPAAVPADAGKQKHDGRQKGK